jgi:hypothetical protein
MKKRLKEFAVMTVRSTIRNEVGETVAKGCRFAQQSGIGALLFA